MKSGTRALLIIVAALVGIGVVTFFNRMKTNGDGSLVTAVTRSRSPVTVITARAEDLAETISHTDTVQAAHDVMLTAEVAGKVVKVHKDLGDRCRKGEALLQLDGEPYKIAASQAEAVLEQAKAQLAQARRDQTRADELVQRSTVAAKTAEVARTGVQTAAAGAKQAGAALRLARRNLRLTRITCPFDGLVAERLVTRGQMVGNATLLARLVDRTTLKLTVKVPAADLTRFKVGQPVALSDPSIAGSSFAGTVSRLGVAADQLTHTFPVEISVQSGGDAGAPRPGQVLRARVTVATHPGALAVPQEAVIYVGADKAPTLALARGDKAHPVKVKLGPRLGGRILVRAGLKAGDQVITVGQHGLKEGAPIEVMGGAGAKPAEAPGAASANKPAKGKK